MAHILIIEDDPLFRQLFEESFQLIGVETTSATNGKQGIELLATIQPDMVVVDLQIPHVSGFEVIRHIRASEAYQHVKIVAVTGDVHAQNAPEATMVDLFELKPVVIQLLLEKIKVLLT